MTRTLTLPAQLFREGATQNDGDGLLELSISSDAPYMRQDRRTGQPYYEVLSHAPSDIDQTRLKKGTALLYNHDRNIILGRNVAFHINAGKVYVESRLSKAADVASYITKINERILVDASVGYELQDEGQEIAERDGFPVYKFRWAPYEASMVSVPADLTVGVGRSRSVAWEELREVKVTPKPPRTIAAWMAEFHNPELHAAAQLVASRHIQLGSSFEIFHADVLAVLETVLRSGYTTR